ncbi:MAG TPA: YCF48-related protein, partial [Marinobacter sp.]|nr:YCF48-related protein [Marinobacter sp.]
MATRNRRPTCACPGFVAAISLAALCVFTPSTAFAVADLLELPARSTELAATSLLTDVTRTGDSERLVAVGERGHIIYSDNGGANWVQASVPVSVTLTGVDFGSANHGWAVGHSGAVLHSSDAGASWALQMTGIQAANLAIAGVKQEI